MNTTVERVRAVLRLLGPDEITPTGRRMIELVLNDEEQKAKYPGARWTPEEIREQMRAAGIPPMGQRTEGTERYIDSGEYEGEYEKD